MLTVFLFEAVGRYLRYRSEIAGIEALDDRLLHDIGRNRSELRAAAWDTVLHGTSQPIG